MRGKRKEAGLSIQAMSIKAGLSRVHLSQLERGLQNNPTLDVLARLLKALDADWEEFLTETGYMKPKKAGNNDKSHYDLAEEAGLPTKAHEKPSRYKPS